MELLTKTRKELVELAGKLGIEVPANMKDETLRNRIESEAIRKTIEIEETARLRSQEESRMRRDIAEIRAEAGLCGINIKIPAKPTLADIVKLRKKVNLIKKEPKPSPETVAIEGGIDPITGKTVEPSRKVYARFINREQEDMDIPNVTVGGKYFFHLWPDKIHVLPEWLIRFWRKNATVPVFEKVMVAMPEKVGVGQRVESTVQKKNKPRFLFEILGDAPDKAKFGVVLDEKILAKLEPKEVEV